MIDASVAKPLSERIVSMIVAIDVPPQRIIDEIRALEAENKALKEKQKEWAKRLKDANDEGDSPLTIYQVISELEEAKAAPKDDSTEGMR